LVPLALQVSKVTLEQQVQVVYRAIRVPLVQVAYKAIRVLQEQVEYKVIQVPQEQVALMEQQD
jgi:hypothetical protein